jgi:hypothetical protein
MPYSTGAADLAVWRDAADFFARSAVCEALGHPLAPLGVRGGAGCVRVALAAAALALKVHGSPDASCRMLAEVAALVAQARDLLATAAERLEGGEA